MCYIFGMDEKKKMSIGQKVFGVCSLLLLCVCFLVGVKSCKKMWQHDAVPVSCALLAGDAVVVETGLESGTVAFTGQADMKKWEECSAAGDIDGKMRIEKICKSLGGGCRLHDGVRGVVHQVDGEWVRIAVGARLWWVQDYALKRAD